MFRTFRNKVFAIYFLSILLLLSGSLSFVYIRSYNEMKSSIDQRLNDTKNGPNDHLNGELDPNNKSQVPSSLASDENFNFDDARDLTVYQNEDLELKLNEYLGDSYVIDYQSETITADDETYVFRDVGGVIKVVKVTYDLQYIDNLKTTLVMFGTLVIILFSSLGFILITKLVKPLEESYEVQNRFVSDASHELKTPLAIIKSCLQLIEKEDEDKDNLIVYCQDETDRLIRLTSELLQLSENDNYEYEPVNVSKLLEILISGIEVGLFEKKIKLDLNLMPNIKAKVAKDDITQLTHILIDNAVKYNDERRKVSLKLSVHNRNMFLAVSNSSDLITDDNLEHLFDRFYRVDKSRTEKGFGLGLSLAKHITEKYNGDIKAEYASGYFTVNVRIPLS